MDGTDDSADFDETVMAMNTMNMSSEEQSEVFQLVSGIMHLGNVLFREADGGGETAIVEDSGCECVSIKN